MSDGEAILAWILYWLFTAISTVATLLIVGHHRSRRLAVASALLILAFFVGLFFGLRFLLQSLGL